MTLNPTGPHGMCYFVEILTCIIMKLADLELHAMERSDVTLSLFLPYISVHINHNSNSIPN